MRTLVILFAVAAASAEAGAQASTVEKELVAARDTVWHAYFANDTVLLRRFIPPAAATLKGGSATRWSTRADIVEGARQFAASKTRLVDLAFENTDIVRAGHTALVHSNYRLVFESDGKRDTTRGRATELFVRHGGSGLSHSAPVTFCSSCQ